MSFLSGITNNKYFKGALELGAAAAVAGGAYLARPLLGQKGALAVCAGAAILGVDALLRIKKVYQEKPKDQTLPAAESLPKDRKRATFAEQSPLGAALAKTVPASSKSPVSILRRSRSTTGLSAPAAHDESENKTPKPKERRKVGFREDDALTNMQQIVNVTTPESFMFGPISNARLAGMSFYFPIAKEKNVMKFQTIDAAYNALCFPEKAEEFSGSWTPSFEVLRKQNQELGTANPVSLDKKKELMRIVLKDWMIYQLTGRKDHPFLSDENLLKMTHPDFPDFGQMAVALKREVITELVIFGPRPPYKKPINVESEYRSEQSPMVLTQHLKRLSYVEARHASSQMFKWNDWNTRKEEVMFGVLVKHFKMIGTDMDEESLRGITHPDFDAFEKMVVQAKVTVDNSTKSGGLV